MKLFKLGLLGWIASVGYASAAYLSWDDLAHRFERVGGSPMAFEHVRCFLDNYDQARFEPFAPLNPNFNRRCYDHGPISLGTDRYALIIDYTLPNDRHRLFLIDRLQGTITTSAVAHGKYDAGILNRRLRHNRNSVLQSRYFSNEEDSNASPSGFHIAGQEYEGRFGDSIVLFGLEEGINHNSCERTIVIHSHLMVSRDNARIMSAGCPMVSSSMMPTLIHAIGGERIAEDDIGLKRTGGLVYIFTDREAALAQNCHL